jgi:branched-chain amino acid transport system substrate-binding protein
LVKYVTKVLGLKKVAVFHEQNDYAIGLKNFFVPGQEAGIKVTGVEAYTKTPPTSVPRSPS